jgi:hypothetical protein
MGITKQVLKRVKLEILFGDLLDCWITEYARVETSNYDYHDVSGMTLRSYLRKYALDLVRENEVNDDLPAERDMIDTLVSWNKEGYIVELAWVGYEEIKQDDWA